MKRNLLLFGVAFLALSVSAQSAPAGAVNGLFSVAENKQVFFHRETFSIRQAPIRGVLPKINTIPLEWRMLMLLMLMMVGSICLVGERETILRK